MQRYISILLMCLFGVLSAPMIGAAHDMAGASMEMHHDACPDCDAEVDGEHGVCPHAVICSLYFDLPLFIAAGELPVQIQITVMPEPWSAGSLSQEADPHPPRSPAGLL